MGSSKRERQKQGRQARNEEAHRMQRRAGMRRRTFTVVGVMVAVLAVAFLLSLRGGSTRWRELSMSNFIRHRGLAKHEKFATTVRSCIFMFCAC